MPAQTGSLCFDAVAEPKWDVPVATIGGLPIAVIDRARSAALMVDTALARRNTAQRPLVFTSANGQVLSMCARDARIRDLFLDADLIHADGMPMVFVSRLSQQDAAAGAGRDHRPVPRYRDCRSAARRQYLSFGSDQGGRGSSGASRPRTLSRPQDRRIQQRLFSPRRRRGAASSPISIMPSPDILWLGLGAPAEQSFAARNRDQLHGVGLDQNLGRPVRLSLRQEFAGAGLDATARVWNGPIASILSRAVSPAAIS